MKLVIIYKELVEIQISESGFCSWLRPLRLAKAFKFHSINQNIVPYVRKGEKAEYI